MYFDLLLDGYRNGQIGIQGFPGRQGVNKRPDSGTGRCGAEARVSSVHIAFVSGASQSGKRSKDGDAVTCKHSFSFTGQPKAANSPNTHPNE
jgi:hypothetical protein